MSIEELEEEVKQLKQRLSEFEAVTVHLRLPDGKIYPVEVFAIDPRPTPVKHPAFSVVK